MPISTPAATAAPPPPTPPAERQPAPLPHCASTTPDDPQLPAESVRVTDVSATDRGRAYLVERELEQDGYSALKALVSDYVAQAELLADVPMAVSPLTGTRTESLDGGGR